VTRSLRRRLSAIISIITATASRKVVVSILVAALTAIGLDNVAPERLDAVLSLVAAIVQASVS